MAIVRFSVLGRATTAASETNPELAAKLRKVEADFQRLLEGLTAAGAEEPMVYITWDAGDQMSYDIQAPREVLQQVEQRLRQSRG